MSPEKAEWFMIALMVLGVACFSIGGTGYRFVRFAIMPLLMGLIAYFSAIPLWRDLLFACSLGVVLTLGYGEKIPYWRKALTFSGYSLATLWLGFSWWQVLSPPLILLIFFLSNWKVTSSIFRWKICEASFGFLIAVIVADIISKLPVK
jgi:hypothetical protein